MANRSYLYSTDTLPTETASPGRVLCISEHNYDIPLAHKLLVGRNPRIVPSLIWDPEIGIAGDYAGGAKLLSDLLQAVGRGLEDDEEFADCLDQTSAHLEKQRAEYFHLETGEILTMLYSELSEIEEFVTSLAASEIPAAVARAEAAIAGEDDAYLAELRKDWQEHFGARYGDVLYFSFASD
ncbi:MAG TPA: hypothetical protein VFN97_22555 [Actinospica sp.]|nr:hypothetical protein [Actinospica sp.]